MRLTIKEAYDIVRQKYPGEIVKSCSDSGDFFIFCMIPESLKNEEGLILGSTTEAINKKTGKTFMFDIRIDEHWEIEQKSTPIDIDFLKEEL